VALISKHLSFRSRSSSLAISLIFQLNASLIARCGARALFRKLLLELILFNSGSPGILLDTPAVLPRARSQGWNVWKVG